MKNVKPPYYWENHINEIYEIASNFTSKSQFYRKHKGAAVAAQKLGIYKDVCSHMIKGKNHRNERCIYFIEFPNKVGYVGLTNNFSSREKQHRNSKTSIIAKHKKESNCDFTMIMIDDYMSENDAQIKETYWKCFYTELGYKMLNIAPTGGLGGSNVIHTIETCHQDASGFKTRNEYKKNMGSSYESARANGWLDKICGHMENKFHNWTYKSVLKIAENYTSIWQFGQNNRAAYEWARRNNYLYKISLIVGRKNKDKEFYTKEFCKQESLNCKNRSEFYKKNSMAYSISKENKWLDEFFGKKMINQYK